jgi:hypothetical protein
MKIAVVEEWLCGHPLLDLTGIMHKPSIKVEEKGAITTSVYVPVIQGSEMPVTAV